MGTRSEQNRESFHLGPRVNRRGAVVLGLLGVMGLARTAAEGYLVTTQAPRILRLFRRRLEQTNATDPNKLKQEIENRYGIIFDDEFDRTDPWKNHPEKMQLVGSVLEELPRDFYQPRGSERLLFRRVAVGEGFIGEDPEIFTPSPDGAYPVFAADFDILYMPTFASEAIGEELNPQNPLQARANVTRSVVFAALARIPNPTGLETNTLGSNERVWGEALFAVLKGNNNVITLPDQTHRAIPPSLAELENVLASALNTALNASNPNSNMISAETKAFYRTLYRGLAQDIDFIRGSHAPAGNFLLAEIASEYVSNQNFVKMYAQLLGQEKAQGLYDFVKNTLFRGKEYFKN